MTQQHIVILGCKGQVGSALTISAPSPFDVTALHRGDVDFSNPQDLQAKLAALKPTVIINAAAYTAVDKAEADTAAAHQVNDVAVNAIAEAAARLNAFVVHYSTDYVFNGQASTPYRPSHATDPLSVYGLSKRNGELRLEKQLSPSNYLVLRTQWVHTPGGRNFAATIANALQSKTSLRIVADQVGTPTLAEDIAAATWAAVGQRVSGIHHLTNTGAATWFDFAHAIADEVKKQKPTVQLAELHAISRAEYPLPAKRPAYALLDTSSLANAIGKSQRHWRDAYAAAWCNAFG